MSMNIWKWLSALCAFQFILMVIAVSLFYYQLGIQRMQFGDLLIDISLSLITLIMGTPFLWLIGEEADKRHRTKKKDDI
jgi:hypothetical protein